MRETNSILTNKSFLPIVTTFTVTSKDAPLESCMKDSQLLSRVFSDYQEQVGYKCLPIMGDSVYTAEALGCKIGFREREAFVTEPLVFDTENEIRDYEIPNLERCPRIQLFLEAVRTLSRFASADKPLMVNCTAPLTSAAKTLGIETVLLKMASEPAQIKLFLERVTEFILSFSSALVDSGGDLLFLADPIASTNIISPRMFKEFAFPHLKRIIETIPRPMILHICGNIYPIAQDMAETGAALLSIDHHVNLQKIRERVGDDVLLGGNLDPVFILEKSPEEIALESRKCYSEDHSRKLILMPGCTIIPNTPVENIRAMMRVAEEMTHKN